jgi:hypothetical protein
LAFAVGGGVTLVSVAVAALRTSQRSSLRLAHLLSFKL